MLKQCRDAGHREANVELTSSEFGLHLKQIYCYV